MRERAYTDSTGIEIRYKAIYNRLLVFLLTTGPLHEHINKSNGKGKRQNEVKSILDRLREESDRYMMDDTAMNRLHRPIGRTQDTDQLTDLIGRAEERVRHDQPFKTLTARRSRQTARIGVEAGGLI